MIQMLTNLVLAIAGNNDIKVVLILILFGLMVVGLVLGQELAFVLGGAGVIVGAVAMGDSGVTIAMTKIYDQMQSYSMVAIPMFVLMANFLTHSKVADGLFESIRYLLGPLKGGLGLAVILVSTVFAATTGIVGASVVTMGMLSLPILLRSGYKPSLACGMVCAGGSLGILIPPSIMLVSMGSYAEVSVGKIFFAAIVPGLTLSLGYIIYLMVVCHIHPDWGPAMSKEELAEMPMKKRITGSLVNLIPPLLLIVAVLGSIFGGIATPTEAAGVGAFFALILAILYKQFSMKMLYESIIDTAKTTAMVFIILFGAAAFTGVFMSLDGDQIISNWVLGMGIGKWGAFAIMMVIVFILGMFIDWLGIVMIVFPIFLPIMDQFGFDRLWLVAVTATMLQTCFMTPPFGFALFYVKGILPPEVKIQEVYKGVVPFIAIIVVVTVLCAAFPPLVTGLPPLRGGLKQRFERATPNACGGPPKRGPPFSLVKNGKGNSTGRKGVRGKPRRGFLRVFNQKFSELPALKTCSGWRKCVFDSLRAAPKGGPPFRCHWSCPPRRVENQAKKAAAASARCSGGSWSLVHVSASLDTARRSAENGAAAATVTQPSPCRSRTRMP